MKVLHVITGLGAGGAERSLFNLLRHYPRKDIRHIVCSLHGTGEYGPRIEQMGLQVHAPRRHQLPWAIPQLVKHEKPDIVQGWMYHGNVAALWAATFAITAKPKILWNIRQSLYDMRLEKPTTAAIIRLSARLSNFPSHIIYNSHLAVQHHEAIGFAPARRLLIPNGFDTRLFRPDRRSRSQVRHELAISDDTALIGMVARYHPVKDHTTFLNAARFLLDRHPRCAFVLVGAGTNGAIARKAVEERGLSGHVHLLGARTDIPAIMAALDIAALTSVAEAFPNIIGEAMASGVPCVVTDVGDAAAIVGDTGIAVPRGEPGLFAQALEAMITRTDRATLCLKARARIEEFFSIAATVEMYQKAYEALTADL